MTTLNAIVYSIEAAKRILNLKNGIVKVVEWAWVVLVVGKNFSRFISKKLFKKHFVDNKKEQAKKLQAFSTNAFDLSLFQVKGNSDTYYQTASNHGVSCTCKDYQRQLGAIGQAVCKHGYAVLNTLGFESLSDYLVNRKHGSH